MKKSRFLSFVIVIVAYVLALLIGLFIFTLNLTNSFFINVLLADVVATIFIFLTSLIFKNASMYDPYWSVAPIFIVFFSLKYFKNYHPLTIILFVVICIWGVRLTLNWAYTFKSLLHQDWRYTMFKNKTGKMYPLVNFFGIHLVPTLVVYFALLPALHYIKGDKVNYLSLIGLVISLLATIIQLISDLQLHKFRKNNARTKCINIGLWKYSRHPNYLGEVLMWWGIYIFGLINDLKSYYLIIGAILNTCLFLFISIPLQENRLKTYKENYEEYIKTTSKLLILPKR